MDYRECYKILKQYNKWRRGKGKKYVVPNLPFDATMLGNAIDLAILCTKAVARADGVLSKGVDEQA